MLASSTRRPLQSLTRQECLLLTRVQRGKGGTQRGSGSLGVTGSQGHRDTETGHWGPRRGAPEPLLRLRRPVRGEGWGSGPSGVFSWRGGLPPAPEELGAWRVPEGRGLSSKRASGSRDAHQLRAELCARGARAAQGVAAPPPRGLCRADALPACEQGLFSLHALGLRFYEELPSVGALGIFIPGLRRAGDSWAGKCTRGLIRAPPGCARKLPALPCARTRTLPTGSRAVGPPLPAQDPVSPACPPPSSLRAKADSYCPPRRPSSRTLCSQVARPGRGCALSWRRSLPPPAPSTFPLFPAPTFTSNPPPPTRCGPALP